MGHRPRRTVFDLKFEDTTGDDETGDPLKVRAKSVSTARLLEIQSMAGELQSLDVNDPAATPELMKRFVELVHVFSSVIIEWNVEDDDGQAVAPTEDALLDQEPGFMLMIIMAWANAVAGVASPLPNGSLGGVNRDIENSMSMENLVPSPVS